MTLPLGSKTSKAKADAAVKRLEEQHPGKYKVENRDALWHVSLESDSAISESDLTALKHTLQEAVTDDDEPTPKPKA